MYVRNFLLYYEPKSRFILIMLFCNHDESFIGRLIQANFLYYTMYQLISVVNFVKLRRHYSIGVKSHLFNLYTL